MAAELFQISVVDDNEPVRESLAGLFESLGHPVEVFSSAESFLICKRDQPGSFELARKNHRREMTGAASFC